MLLQHWDRVREVFDAIANADSASREKVLATLEPAVRVEAEWMLANHDAAQSESGGLLDSPVPSNADLLEWLLDAQVFDPREVLLERFEIHRLIGRGGMGEVYEAFDRTINRVVALKTIKFELRQDQRVIERFRSEVQKARDVTHPNVCRVHELHAVLEKDGSETFFYSMEFLGGTTLEDEIAEQGPLKADEVVRIAAMVCGGVQEAHSCKVIHRDLKCSNIILTRQADGRGLIAKITDFGLARELPSDGDTLITGVAEKLSGTAAYMAPELLEGKKASTASDIYALGVVLYRMVTARSPFEAETDFVSATMRLKHPPVAPSKHVPALPAAWEDAILRCLEPDPLLRPETAADVLNLFIGDAPARRKYLARRWSRQLHRRRWMVLGGVGIAAILYSQRQEFASPPYISRLAKLFVEDFPSFDAGQVLGRSARNVVRLAVFGIPNLHVISPKEIAAAVKDLSLGTAALRGESAMRVAKQVGAEILVSGGVEREAPGLRVSLVAKQLSSGQVLFRTVQRADDARSLPAAVSRATASLSLALVGAELASSAVGRIPFSDVNSDIPDAVQEFTTGLDFFVNGEAGSALEHLRRATDLDKDFAIAWIYQATVAGTERKDELAFESAKRAYELRSRVGPRERVQAEATWYSWTGDLHRFVERQKQLVSEFPAESHLHRQLAQGYSLIGMVDDALRHGREAVQLDPRIGNNSMIYAAVLAQANRLNEADQVITAARSRGATNQPALLSAEALVLLLRGKWQDSLAKLAELERQPRWELHAREHAAQGRILHGQLRDARYHLESSVSLARAHNDVGREDFARYYLGVLHFLYGENALAVRHAESLIARQAEPHRINTFRAAAEISFLANAPSVLDEAASKLGAIEQRYASRRSTGIALQVRGWQAALAGARDESVQRLRQAYDLWGDVATTWALADLLQRYGDFSSALPLYRSVRSRKGLATRLEQQALWVLGLAQLSRCCRLAGMEIEATDAAEEFLRHWGSQSDLPLVQQIAARR